MSTIKDTYILNKALKLQQIEGGFHTGMDAVMLAAACPAKDGDHILDLGCGVGGASLAVLHRIQGAKLTGIDIQDDHVALAQENAKDNSMQKRSNFICADIREYHASNYDHVICNPPYMEAGAHAPSPSVKRAKALGHDETSIEEWIACAFNCIKGQGSLTMIHRADMIQKITLSVGKRFGSFQIIPLWPRDGEQAKRVIIRCWKHKKTPAMIHPGIVLHTCDGHYTEMAENILRKAGKIT